MKFIDKVKRKLINTNEREIANIEKRITELREQHSVEYESVQALQEESERASKDRQQVQSSIMDKKELADIEMIYDFVLKFPMIERMTAKFKNIDLLFNNDFVYVLEDDNESFDMELNRRNELCETLKKLNEDIIQIKQLSREELFKDFNPNQENKKETEDREERVEEIPQQKIGFFARLFGKKNKAKMLEPGIPEEPKREESLFDRYRKGINEFLGYYNKFIVVTLEEPTIIDKNLSSIILTNINQIIAISKRVELLDEDKEYLEIAQPIELWREIARYYVNISDVTNAIQNFEKNFDKFIQMYEENLSLFDIENLERILVENGQMLADLRNKNKVASSKKGEVARKKQCEKEIRAQIRTLESKKEDLIRKSQSIQRAQTLNDLGYKSKEDASRKLSIPTKDYVVIPIPIGVVDISKVFEDKKNMRVQIDGKTFFAEYSNEVASGMINFLEPSKDSDSAIMIPISSLKKEDIDNIRDRKIAVKKSVLELDGVFIISPKGKSFKNGDSFIRLAEYSFGSVREQVARFLEDDFQSGTNEIGDYDIFKGIPNISIQEKKLKREAVKKCLSENIKRDISSTEVILVDGKSFFLNKDDEKEINTAPKTETLNEKLLTQIADEIETYLIEDGKRSTPIDLFYKKLLAEYLRVNKKAKSDYYEEDNTTVSLNGKEYRIKPTLPSNDEKIAKKYSRPKEDIAYKTMKLAGLVNKFAHLTENQELQDMLFDVKHDLIESAIDLSKDNPNINIKKRFDESKMVMSVVLEIPRYNMIALHAKNKGNSLSYKANRLDEHKNEILQSSAILAPGVNKDLLMAMKKLQENERGQFLLDLEPTVFYKLALRMGYTSESFSSESERKKFIKQMTSDKKLDELLEESEELEK